PANGRERTPEVKRLSPTPRYLKPPAARNITYSDDGDLIIRAGNTLFEANYAQVHKFLLSRDSSMFEDMFAVPETSIAVDGLTDETPLFVADSAEAFEALLWILYALPPELRPYQLCVPHAVDLDRILLVAEITNKYHFVSLETWSIKIIESIVPAVSFTETRMSFLMRTMTLAERVSNGTLSNAVMVAWEGALQRGVNPGPLLAILDRDGPSSLSTRTYYAQLFRMKVVPGTESPNNLPYLSECESLSEPQITKLLFARWSLDALVFPRTLRPCPAATIALRCSTQITVSQSGKVYGAAASVRILSKRATLQTCCNG
ncbi:hypothetical protein R3P38DRAFT_2555849, partial [Favolaschia claudopus]